MVERPDFKITVAASDAFEKIWNIGDVVRFDIEPDVHGLYRIISFGPPRQENGVLVRHVALRLYESCVFDDLTEDAILEAEIIE